MPELIVPWTRATLEDVEAFSFLEFPHADIEASPHALGSIYEEELTSQKTTPDSAVGRVLAMLASALKMHSQLELPKSPYGPMMQLQDRRTAIPADWSGEAVSALARLGERATNPAVQARLLDVAWFLQRHRVNAGHAAAASYLSVAKRVYEGALVDADDEQLPGAKMLTVRNALRRGLQICMQLRPPEPEVNDLSAFVLEVATHLETANDFRGLYSMLELSHEFDIGDPSHRANRIEHLAEASVIDIPHLKSDALVLAAKDWRVAKDTEGYERCLMAASQVLAENGRSMNHAFSGSHWLQQALDILRGLRSPVAKERKRDLRIELIRMQAAAEDEMGFFEHPFDIAELVKDTTAQLENITLVDGLFFLASISRSRQPDELMEEARRTINQFPLSSLFGVQQYDADSYVRYRAPGTGFGEENAEAIEYQIAKAESLTRSLIVEGQIKIILENLATHFSILEDDLAPFCRDSPFVPTDLNYTFTRGLTAFLHGDMRSAVAILIPLMESSLVYVLKGHEVDVVNHDDQTGTQEDMTITQLFAKRRTELDKIFGKAITDDINRVFLARSGPGLRHAVAHGTLNDHTAFGTDAVYACWLMFCLCLTPFFDQYRSSRRASQQEPQTLAQQINPAADSV
ncbi:DUF7380 domain-containing protein [Xanthomonas arboricola]|uniref:DUF7380 domain-containing protein n=1 Tax=Xanthomonas arboricola TaxID=56448 RepID=UPI0011B014B1|nr:hypothetical protein [Xanthomonas arboricola]